MPRKTKKQKILANQHRQNLLTTKLPEVKEQVPVKIQEKIPQPIATPPERSYFFSDFKKSLILTAIVVALEITLYYARLIK